MKIQTFVVGKLRTNCYLVYDENSLEASVVDPGGDYQKIKTFLDENQLKLKNIFLTHGHFDHILAVAQLREATGARVVIHKADAGMLETADDNMYMSIMSEPFRRVKADILLSGGEKTKVGTVEAQFLHTPGHTPGSVCIFMDNVIFTGDTLFKNDIGRTDLEGGSELDMKYSLRSLYDLEDDYILYPGHYNSTTLFAEKKNNPYLRDAGIRGYEL
ncbi:MAG: MBL fold metallo-hydrolase [Clostridia bacterium]|nr:MBL fold metallo-hydrolase [Oscillospiraceae bacterium]MBQ6990864.1 MBL fold metallo-hydrolase [Clostridia bacterium]